MRPPFATWTAAGRERAFVPLVVLTLGVMAALRVLDAPLQTAAAPHGIVSFELAGDLETARGMIGSWGHRGEVHAALSLGLDYLFLVLYAGAIALGCVLVAGALAPRVGAWLAWGQLAAAALDAVENYALIRVLLGSPRELWPPLAAGCAGVKFALVAAGLAYVAIGTVVAALRGRSDQPD